VQRLRELLGDAAQRRRLAANGAAAVAARFDCDVNIEELAELFQRGVDAPAERAERRRTTVGAMSSRKRERARSSLS